jgi:hypothetical protein
MCIVVARCELWITELAELLAPPAAHLPRRVDVAAVHAAEGEGGAKLRERIAARLLGLGLRRRLRLDPFRLRPRRGLVIVVTAGGDERYG